MIGSEYMFPEVSVILSTYNAYERLKNCLYSLTLQEYPLSLIEVIVIDDCSTDKTENYIKNTKFPFRVFYKKNEKNYGRSYTRNKGIELSSGKVLLFCDCDMILPPDFVQNHLNYHNKSDNLVVCGSFWQQVPLTHRPTFESIKNRSYQEHSYEQPWANWFKEFVHHYGNNLSSFYFPWMYFVVMNVSVRKEHAVNAGYFDEAFKGYGGEDEEFGYRLYKNGLRFVVDPKIKNYHQEHNRSLSEGAESQSNIQHIVNKHPNMDIILFYQFPQINHFYKNAVLIELNEFFRIHEHLRTEFEEKFLHFAANQTYDEMMDFYHFTSRYPCPLLRKMVLKIFKNRRRFR
jgi:glycosyltransferase involved in cell wall biosynthesis